MVIAGRLLVALAVAGMVAPRAWADVIPTTCPERTEAQEKVQARLAQIGLPPAEAEARAASLSPEEAAYFSSDPSRLQAAGRQEIWAGQSDNLWWEWLFGAAALGGAVALIVVFGTD